MEACLFCRGPVQESRIRHVHRWGEGIVVFEHVPAEVCQQCGEVYLDPNVLEAIDVITSSEAEPEAILSVPVYSLAAAKSG